MSRNYTLRAFQWYVVGLKGTSLRGPNPQLKNRTVAYVISQQLLSIFHAKALVKNTYHTTNPQNSNYYIFMTSYNITHDLDTNITIKDQDFNLTSSYFQEHKHITLLLNYGSRTP